MENCIICKILRNELPSHKVYEDEHNIAILDIFPRSNGHTLVIPKRHCPNFSDLTNKEATQLVLTGKKVLNAIHKSDILSQGANLIINENPVAGQEILHVHLHIVPRNTNDSMKLGPGLRLKEKDRDDFELITKKIKKYLT